MQHDTTGPIDDRVDSPFRNGILVVGIGCREVNALTFELTIGLELLAVEWVVICTEALDFNISITADAFKQISCQLRLQRHRDGLVGGQICSPRHGQPRWTRQCTDYCGIPFQMCHGDGL